MHNAQCTIEVCGFAAQMPIRACQGSEIAYFREYRQVKSPNGHNIAEGDTFIVHCALCIVHWRVYCARRRKNAALIDTYLGEESTIKTNDKKETAKWVILQRI